MSLIPEKTLSLSPSLATTIGLEEAVLVQVLNELVSHGVPESSNGYRWITTEFHKLQELTPFWDMAALQRLCFSLRDKGILLIASAPLIESLELRFAFNEQAPCGKTSTPGSKRNKPDSYAPTNTPPATKTLPPQWQPEADVLYQLNQYNIPTTFIDDQLAEFITYWTERNEPQFSWGSKFIKHVLRLWRAQQTETAKRSRQSSMSSDWTPSEDAMEILTRQSGINRNFIEDAIPEFVLYWMERGERSNTWNSRFIMHVKRQWARFTATMEHDYEPKLIPTNWTPSEDLFEILSLANIPRDFAEKLTPEFVLYWKESGQAHSSWNTKFLQQVKREWSRQQSANTQVIPHGQQRTHRPNSTRSSNLIDELSDRSWAGT
jgi:hypothetical protein